MIEKQYLEYEKAIKLLADSISFQETEKKSVVFHCINVGTLLYQNGYSREMVLAGYLHDLLEDSEVTARQIKDQFGEEVLKIIEANSKNPSIKDPDLKKADMVSRCLAAGYEAIIVKAADILDNYYYYEKKGDQEGLIYGAKMLTLLFRGLNDSNDGKIRALIENPIVMELQKFLEKYPLK